MFVVVVELIGLDPVTTHYSCPSSGREGGRGGNRYKMLNNGGEREREREREGKREREGRGKERGRERETERERGERERERVARARRYTIFTTPGESVFKLCPKQAFLKETAFPKNTQN